MAIGFSSTGQVMAPWRASVRPPANREIAQAMFVTLKTIETQRADSHRD
jgi:hypothetical protein